LIISVIFLVDIAAMIGLWVVVPKFYNLIRRKR
jgi:hypothetical protein